MSRQAKTIQSVKNEVPKLAEVMRCHIRQTVTQVTEVVSKLRESADRASKTTLHIVKVPR